MMKRKITGMFVCMLLIFATAFSVAETMIIDQTEGILSLSPHNFSDDMCDITWTATLDFIETDANIDNVVFAEAADACDGHTGSGSGNDAYDVQKPPAPMVPYIRAWFNDGLDIPFNCMQEDYRQYPDTSKVWNLSVQWAPEDYESPTNITISWNTTEIDDSEYDSVVLYDVSGAIVVADMLVDTQYTFNASAMTPKAFEIICSLNEPPVFSDENPSNGSVDVPITTSQLTVTIRDPEGDSFNWSIETSPDIGSSSGIGESNGTKTCTVSGLDYDTTYTWYVNATDSGSGMWSREVYTFTTESAPPEPDLECYGRLNWTNVTHGSTVTGSFTVENIGDPGSELDWEVTEWPPDWGSGWTFVPSSGNDLASGDSVTVQVTVIAPDEKNQQYSGQIKIENSENSSDSCTIDVSLATPVSQNSVFLQFIERLIHQFPLLERILSSFSFLGRILSLK